MKKIFLILLSLMLLTGCDENNVMVIPRNKLHTNCGNHGIAVSSHVQDYVIKEEHPNLFSIYIGTMVTCKDGTTVLVTSS